MHDIYRRRSRPEQPHSGINCGPSLAAFPNRLNEVSEWIDCNIHVGDSVIKVITSHGYLR